MKPSSSSQSLTELEAEISGLPELTLEQLRGRWKELFGNPAPKTLRRTFLAHAIGYQMQLNAFGGLSSATKRRLRQIAEAARRGKPDPVGVGCAITAGTQLIREWKGETHVVTAQNNGFEWNGRTYASLSAIANEITGTSWNGYTFFGIKRKSVRNRNAAGRRTILRKTTSS